MLHALASDEFVGNLTDDAGLAAHDKNFKVVVVVKVDMNSRESHCFGRAECRSLGIQSSIYAFLPGLKVE